MSMLRKSMRGLIPGYFWLLVAITPHGRDLRIVKQFSNIDEIAAWAKQAIDSLCLGEGNLAEQDTEDDDDD